MVKMSAPSISLLYTTARLHLIDKVISRWISDADENIDMVVVTDTPLSRVSEHPNVKFIQNLGAKNCVSGWNTAASAASGQILVQVSDDLLPPRLWATSIRNIVQEMRKVRSDVALNLLDQICARKRVHHPVITRECYEKNGYLYPPDFESMFCDNWFFAYHTKYSYYATSKRPFWVHEHRTTHKVAIDEVTLLHESPERYKRGRATFMKYVVEHGL